MNSILLTVLIILAIIAALVFILGRRGPRL